MKCRHCGEALIHSFVDLGSAPPSNAYLTAQALKASEKWYPLKVLVCHQCWLVQTEDFVGEDEIFSEDYAYFSSFSSSWLNHAESYVEKVAARFSLTHESTVVEVAANDGYLLQYVKNKNIACYGIEPTRSTAQAARDKGIEVIETFFGETKAKALVQQDRQADLMVANNVLAHVPDINDFVKGFATLLKPHGVVTFEFPHLLNLVEKNQFDTIYHEHYSYLSFIAVEAITKANGLSVFDVETQPTHGGSLRIYAQRTATGEQPINETVAALKQQEINSGITTLAFYQGFQVRAEKIKMDLLIFLLKAKQQGKSVVAYGAAAKGNTLLNFSGVHADLIAYVVDKNPAKQNKCMPGSRIPIKAESALQADRPDYVIILPWNLKQEVMAQLDYLAKQGTQFVVAVPELVIE